MGINWNKPQPAPTIVWDLVHNYFQQTRFIGIMREPGHQDHSEGRALDIGLNAFNSEDRWLAYELIRIFREVGGEVGWSYLIWNKQIWYNDKRGGPHDKGFKGDHTDHIHIS